MDKVNSREIWVDDVKVIACILVAVGHFLMSMIGEPDVFHDNDLCEWFVQAIYYFHVPLFFICSGYLYQKLNVIDSWNSWTKNILKKLLVLGVPYLTFSFITWGLKVLFSGTVNNQLNGLTETLFMRPTAPYWYLYSLFFIFLITPTFKDKNMQMAGIIISVMFKAVSLTGVNISIYAISTVLSNEIWFVIGMCLHIINFSERIKDKIWQKTGITCAVLFIISSIIVYIFNLSFWGKSFLLGFTACMAVLLLTAGITNSKQQNKVFGFLSKYTMPIFLMHTIFAATIRIALLKIGVYNVFIHFAAGIGISFMGPIMAAEIMKKIKGLEFFLYPGKFIKIR